MLMELIYLDTTEESLREDEYHRGLEARYDNSDLDCIEETIKAETTDLLSGLDESKIKRGVEFKNYKEMCEELGIGYKSGDTKKKQMKEIEVYYFLYKQNGRRIKITKVHNLTDIEKRVRTLKSNYKDYIEELIINIMIDEIKKRECKYGEHETTLGESVILSQGQLARAIGMVNKHYATVMSNRHTHCKLKNYDINVFDDWSNSFYGFMKRAIRGAIENLRDKRLIIYETRIAVCEFSNSDVVKLKDADGDEYLGTKDKDRRVLKVRLATEDEKNKMSVLLKNCESFSPEECESKFSDILIKEMGLYNISEVYVLGFSDDIAQKYTRASEIDFGLTPSAKRLYVSEMNKKIIQKVQTNTKTRHIKAISDKDEDGAILKESIRLNREYIEQCNEITRDVLSHNIRSNISKNIKDKK